MTRFAAAAVLAAVSVVWGAGVAGAQDAPANTEPAVEWEVSGGLALRSSSVVDQLPTGPASYDVTQTVYAMSAGATLFGMGPASPLGHFPGLRVGGMLGWLGAGSGPTGTSGRESEFLLDFEVGFPWAIRLSDKLVAELGAAGAICTACAGLEARGLAAGRYALGGGLGLRAEYQYGIALDYREHRLFGRVTFHRWLAGLDVRVATAGASYTSVGLVVGWGGF